MIEFTFNAVIVAVTLVVKFSRVTNSENLHYDFKDYVVACRQ